MLDHLRGACGGEFSRRVNLDSQLGAAISLELVELLFTLGFFCIQDALYQEDGLIGSKVGKDCLYDLVVFVDQHVSQSAIVDDLHNLVHEFKLVDLELITRQPLGSDVLLYHSDGLVLKFLILFHNVLAVEVALLLHFKEAVPHIGQRML